MSKRTYLLYCVGVMLSFYVTYWAILRERAPLNASAEQLLAWSNQQGLTLIIDLALHSVMMIFVGIIYGQNRPKESTVPGTLTGGLRSNLNPQNSTPKVPDARGADSPLHLG